jgi:hypothetical protein
MHADPDLPLAVASTVSPPVEPDGFLDRAPSAPVKPAGKRHDLGRIGLGHLDFIEAFPGYFELWDNEERVGSVERTSTVSTPARIFHKGVGAQKPEFVVTREWNETTFVVDDIYMAVRRLDLEWNEERVPA